MIPLSDPSLLLVDLPVRGEAAAPARERGVAIALWTN